MGYASTKPKTMHVTRSLVIKAPAEAIFALIHDFRAWSQWSPYEAKDPNMQKTYGEKTVGVGAYYAWDGDKNVGKGSMELIESIASSKVSIKLDFEKPFEGHNRVDFNLTPEGDGVHVEWAMTGPSPLMTRVVGLFMDMDKMIGGDFAVGLENLKRAAEA